MNARLARLLDAAYAEPCPFETTEEFQRAHHDDIARLSLEEVDAERLLARLRWAVLIHHREDPSAWLEERIQRLDSAAAQLRKRAIAR